MPIVLPALLIGATAAIVPAAAQAPAPPIALALPIDCAPGSTCFVQQYPDHDPGPAARDYRCGTRSYDGHDGTDIRLPSMVARRRGVAVLAAAAGTVRGVRDGEPEGFLKDRAPGSTVGRECGNGVVVTHPDGWETQYCHMARGSIAVREGEAVTTGRKLGLVGLSGNTEFPHVHLSVRQGGEKVDPFAYGAPAGACGAGRSLWTATAARALAYRASEAIETGFAPAPVTPDGLEQGRGDHAVTRTSPALIFYVRLMGLRDGDRLGLAITAPDGSMLAKSDTPIVRDKALWMSFVGKKRPPAGSWPTGRYRGVWRLERAGKPVAGGQGDVTL